MLGPLLCMLLALAAEMLAALLLHALPGPFGARELLAVAGPHLFAAVTAAEALRRRYRAGDPGREGAWRLGLALALLVPGFGLLLLLVLVVRTPPSVRVRVDDLISPMEHRRLEAEAERASEARQLGVDVNVEAIGDALKDADKAKRLGAVEALRAMENRQAVELLAKSLTNTVFEVRYHAVEALAGIGKKHSELIARATAAAERLQTADAYRQLGQQYLDYAVLGMEEESIQLHLFRNAAANLRRSLELGGAADAGVLVGLGTALDRLGELEQAWHAFRSALERHPESFEALLGTARVQYQRGEFDQLRVTCRRLLELPGAEDQRVNEVLLLWAEGPAAVGLGS